jgi:hypothetical protein
MFMANLLFLGKFGQNGALSRAAPSWSAAASQKQNGPPRGAARLRFAQKPDSVSK